MFLFLQISPDGDFNGRLILHSKTMCMINVDVKLSELFQDSNDDPMIFSKNGLVNLLIVCLISQMLLIQLWIFVQPSHFPEKNSRLVLVPKCNFGNSFSSLI